MTLEVRLQQHHKYPEPEQKLFELDEGETKFNLNETNDDVKYTEEQTLNIKPTSPVQAEFQLETTLPPLLINPDSFQPTLVDDHQQQVGLGLMRNNSNTSLSILDIVGELGISNEDAVFDFNDDLIARKVQANFEQHKPFESTQNIGDNEEEKVIFRGYFNSDEPERAPEGKKVDRTNFADVSRHALERLERAKKIFLGCLAYGDFSNGPITAEIIQFHLVPRCRRQFNHFVRGHGCSPNNRQITPEEHQLISKGRKTPLWFSSVTFTAESQRQFLGKCAAERLPLPERVENMAKLLTTFVPEYARLTQRERRTKRVRTESPSPTTDTLSSRPTNNNSNSSGINLMAPNSNCLQNRLPINVTDNSNHSNFFLNSQYDLVRSVPNLNHLFEKSPNRFDPTLSLPNQTQSFFNEPQINIINNNAVSSINNNFCNNINSSNNMLKQQQQQIIPTLSPQMVNLDNYFMRQESTCPRLDTSNLTLDGFSWNEFSQFSSLPPQQSVPTHFNHLSQQHSAIPSPLNSHSLNLGDTNGPYSVI